MKLNQVLAVEKGLKQRVTRDLTELHKISQKPELYDGHTRTYEPKHEDGEQVPQESKKIQLHGNEVLWKLEETLGELFDITATKDKTNTVTSATVRVDGHTIIEDVPVSYLLFLEKQLDDIYTAVRKLPVLDPSVEWHWSEERNCYASNPQDKNRTEKVPEPVVLHPGTDKHPPQTQLEYRDRVIGTYTTIRFSDALPEQKKADILKRIVRLKDAVKQAREEANAVDAVRLRVGKDVFSYILNG